MIRLFWIVQYGCFYFSCLYTLILLKLLGMILLLLYSFPFHVLINKVLLLLLLLSNAVMELICMFMNIFSNCTCVINKIQLDNIKFNSTLHNFIAKVHEWRKNFIPIFIPVPWLRYSWILFLQKRFTTWQCVYI